MSYTLLTIIAARAHQIMKEHELGRSKEDYLEAILRLIRRNGACRSTDIAEELGFSRASVSVAVRNLEQQGYLIHSDWRILLTEKGENIARNTARKHEFFFSLLCRAGIAEETAEEEACSIEHAISEKSFHLLCSYISGLEQSGTSVSPD